MNRLTLAAGLVAVAALAFAVSAPRTAQSDTAPTETWDERVASLNCEDWQVPGWLDEDGLPTSCVNNEAVPGSHKGEPPAVPVETPAPAPVATETPKAEPVDTPDPAPAEEPETAPETGGCNP